MHKTYFEESLRKVSSQIKSNTMVRIVYCRDIHGWLQIGMKVYCRVERDIQQL